MEQVRNLGSVGKKEEILDSGENGNGNWGRKKSKARTTKHMVQQAKICQQERLEAFARIYYVVEELPHDQLP